MLGYAKEIFTGEDSKSEILEQNLHKFPITALQVPENKIQPKQLWGVESLQIKGLADGKKRVFGNRFGPASSKAD